MPKKPIWVSDYQNEVLRGYLGELLDSNDTPDNDKATLSEIYEQTLEESNVCKHSSIVIHNEQGETTCLQCGQLNP